MSELRQFLSMLDRAGIGYGTRHDYNPDGTAVMVESGESEEDFQITEFGFNSDGQLETVICYQGEVG